MVLLGKQVEYFQVAVEYYLRGRGQWRDNNVTLFLLQPNDLYQL